MRPIPAAPRPTWSSLAALTLGLLIGPQPLAAQTIAGSEFQVGVLDGTSVDPLVEAPPGTAAVVRFFWVDPDDEIEGFQLSIAFSANLTVLNDFTIDGTVLDSIGAEFVDANPDNDLGDGDGKELTVGILLDIFPPFDSQILMPSPEFRELGRVSVEVPATVNECGTVEFVNGLNGGGSGPPIQNVIIVDGQSLQGFTLGSGMVCAAGTPFIRSDCNDDQTINIADMVFLLSFLFQSGQGPNCFVACEMNGDGTLDLADPIYLGNYLFDGGPPPPAPFPDCGTVAGTPDCDSFAGCP